MAVQKRIILLVLILQGLFDAYFIGDAKVIIKQFGNCDQNKKYKSLFNVTLKTVDGVQYADGSCTFLAPLDNDIRTNVSVDMLVGKQYVYMFSINERRSCDALNKYLGEFWYDIQRNAQMMPGLCPIQTGRYRLHNCLLNVDKLTTARNFPFGNLRFTFMEYDSKNDIYTCIIFEAENRF